MNNQRTRGRDWKITSYQFLDSHLPPPILGPASSISRPQSDHPFLSQALVLLPLPLPYYNQQSVQYGWLAWPQMRREMVSMIPIEKKWRMY